MVYSSKDFESLWFLYQAEGLPKNIPVEEFCTKHGVDYPYDYWSDLIDFVGNPPLERKAMLR